MLYCENSTRSTSLATRSAGKFSNLSETGGDFRASLRRVVGTCGEQ